MCTVTPEFKRSLTGLSFRRRYLEPPELNERVEDYRSMDFSATNRAFTESISPLIVYGDTVADMGCGPGDITMMLAEHRPDLRVYGVDFSPEMLAVASAEGAKRSLRNVSWKFGDITRDVFAPGSLGFVISHTMLHHVDDLRPFFFAQIQRALRPTGGFALRDLRRPSNAHIAQEWIRLATGDKLTMRQYELFFYSLRAGLTFEEIRMLVDEMQIHGTLEITSNPDRYWLFTRASR